MPRPPKGLKAKIETTLRLYPCDLLLIHRDADRDGRQKRLEEIYGALEGIEAPPAICVIPIRMLESWFLFDEAAIRRLVGRPKGREPLALPGLGKVEQVADPKTALKEAIQNASGASARRRRRAIRAPVRRIAELIDDFSPLLKVSAFHAFHRDLGSAVNRL